MNKFTDIPFDDIVSFGQRSLLYKDLFSVSWLISRYCTYDCSYCWSHGRSSTKDFRPLPLMKLTIDEIKRQARDNGFNSFHFSFSGGEPTFHPDYLELMKYLADDISNTNYTSVHMTSNCSRPLKWYKTYVEYAKAFHRASITASLHAEYVNTPEKLQEFADKLIFCQQHDIQITINMVMVPTQFDRDLENAMFFHNQGINVTLKPQSDPNAIQVVSGYTAEQLKILQTNLPQADFTSIKRFWADRPAATFAIPKLTETVEDASAPKTLQLELVDSKKKVWYLDQAERLNSFGFNKFKGWECNAGYQGIVITEPAGFVKRSYSCSDVPLGNIETGFKIFDKPQVCISNTCVSSADSKIPKRKV